MSVLVVSDLHLSANPRDEYRFKLMKRLRREATKHHELLIVNGDITEEKDRHTSVLVNRIVDVFAAIAKADADRVQPWATTTTPTLINPFFAFLGHLPNVVVYSKPSHEMQVRQGHVCGNICCSCLTQRIGSATWQDHLKLRVARDCDYVLCHQTFAGDEDA
jgi:hypothetical protein